MSTIDDALAVRRRDVRRVRIAEVVLVAVQLVVVAVLMARLPARPDADEVTAAIYGVMIALGVQVMLGIRVLWILVMGPGSRKVKREVPARAGWLVAASPVLTWLVLVPWIAAGTFDADGEGAPAWLLFLLLVLAAGFGVLATPALLAPVEMAVRGVVTLVRHDDDRTRRADGTGLLRGAAGLGVLTVIVLGGGIALDQPGTGRGSWLVAAAGLLGFPGDYTVRYPLLLWVVRVLVWAILASLAVSWVRRVRARRQGDDQAPDDAAT
ncbi:hypothetical protein [Cellulosimicrobium marinum]|uniref:hypothetical protein n=1 Tax=Cellulosimicrobium marinum TaxID=1638992 RepID=UPI001E595034|nr:hypothetical protein [Cellulosimicrobium marinum]MCB7136006.1 hypothetical protein [Cellulosimicrobium marinum]